MPDKNRRHVDRDIAIQRMLALRDAVPDIAEYIQQCEEKIETLEARLAESERERNYLRAASGGIFDGGEYKGESVETPDAMGIIVERSRGRNTRRHGFLGREK